MAVTFLRNVFINIYVVKIIWDLKSCAICLFTRLNTVRTELTGKNQPLRYKKIAIAAQVVCTIQHK